ncbi:hypothetical protein [Neolewinella agarilytica]|nr:hypothetical protein [Neolewinella agarilytica]
MDYLQEHFFTLFPVSFLVYVIVSKLTPKRVPGKAHLEMVFGKGEE